jgi:hypothetical protein
VQRCILLDIITMRGPINVKSPNNITNWQMRFNSAFKGLILFTVKHYKSLVLSLCTYYCDDMFRPYIGHHQVLVHYVRSEFTR